MTSEVWIINGRCLPCAESDWCPDGCGCWCHDLCPCGEGACEGDCGWDDEEDW